MVCRWNLMREISYIRKRLQMRWKASDTLSRFVIMRKCICFWNRQSGERDCSLQQTVVRMSWIVTGSGWFWRIWWNGSIPVCWPARRSRTWKLRWLPEGRISSIRRAVIFASQRTVQCVMAWKKRSLYCLNRIMHFALRCRRMWWEELWPTFREWMERLIHRRRRARWRFWQEVRQSSTWEITRWN